MQIFIDSANLADIEAALRRGFVRGVTTNPSLLAKEPKQKFEDHIHEIISLIRKYDPTLHLSVEVFSSDPAEILRQAEYFRETFNHQNLSVKVQVGWNELEVIRSLAKKNISVNCTACMTPLQALAAAHAGAEFVSLFWGRIKDGERDEKFTAERSGALADRKIDHADFNPFMVVKRTRDLIDQAGLGSKIIVGSIRGVVDIRDAGLAGAHIATVPPKFFEPMLNHFKTTEVVEMFLKDFKSWLT